MDNSYLDRHRERRRQGRRDNFKKQRGAKALDAAVVASSSPTEGVAAPNRLNEVKDMSAELAPRYDQSNWRSGAVCSPRNNPDIDPEVFFDDKPGRAKKICGSCAVRDFCLEYAVSQDERHGVWGGLTERERRGRRKKLAKGSINRR